MCCSRRQIRMYDGKQSRDSSHEAWGREDRVAETIWRSHQPCWDGRMQAGGRGTESQRWESTRWWCFPAIHLHPNLGPTTSLSSSVSSDYTLHTRTAVMKAMSDQQNTRAHGADYVAANQTNRRAAAEHQCQAVHNAPETRARVTKKIKKNPYNLFFLNWKT